MDSQHMCLMYMLGIHINFINNNKAAVTLSTTALFSRKTNDKHYKDVCNYYIKSMIAVILGFIL